MTLWVLTIVFAATSLFHGGRLVRSCQPRLRHVLHDGSHALMGIAMIVMLWRSARPATTYAYVAVFGAALLWFLYVGTHPSGDRFAHHLQSAAPWYHAVMMASMVWMAVAMALMPAAGPGAGVEMAAMGHGGGHDHTMAVMAPGWVRAGCEIGAIGFFLAALWMVVAGLWWTATGEQRRPPALSVAASCLMAAGMCVAFARMAG